MSADIPRADDAPTPDARPVSPTPAPLSPPLAPKAAAVARSASAVFAESGVAAYLVGGAVRDAMMGGAARDVDIAIAASPHALAPALASALGGKFVSLDAERDIARVIIPSGDGSPSSYLDVSGFEGRIENDLARRDFTVNAMAVELSSALGDDWRVCDPFGGARDLREGALRVSRDSAFADDPVRLLRAVRLCAETGLRADESTQALIRRDAPLLSRTSPERVREELLKTFAAPRAGRSVRAMDALGILSVILPELDESRGVEQPKEHRYDVFGHLLAAVDFADQILRGDFANPIAARETPRFDGMDAYFAQTLSDGHARGTYLKFTALIHDIAKPRTKTVDAATGRVRFLGHSEEGEEMAREIARRLRMGGRAVRHIGAMVRHHLRPRQISNGESLPTRRAVHRYYRDLGDAALDTLYLNMADFLAARGDILAPAEMNRHARTIAHILSVGPQPKVAPARRGGLLTGHDVMGEFGLNPGPAVGAILRLVAEAEAAGAVESREAALSFAKTHLQTTGFGDG